MFKKIFDSAVFLALTTAFFYCVGTASNRGYYSVFRLDPDVLDIGFHNVLYTGLLNSFGIVFKFITVVSLISFVWSHGVLPSYIDHLRKGYKSRRRYVFWKRKILGKREDVAIEQKSKKITGKFFFAVIAMIVFISFLAAVERNGEEKARNILSEGQKDSRRLITLTGESGKLIFLACGSRNCAALDENTKTVRYFSQGKGFSYPL